MDPELNGNIVHCNRERRRRSSRACAIAYASYSENVIARESVQIGIAVLAGVTVSILIALAFF
jgi:hypothetical protein